MENVIVFKNDGEDLVKSNISVNKDVMNLDFYYKNLDCDVIDIPFISNKLASKRIDVIIDDNGKPESRIPTAIILQQGKLIDYIAGSIMFASVNEEGETIGLTNEQIDYIKTLKRAELGFNGKIYKVLEIEV